MRVVCCRYRPAALRKPRSEGAEGEASLGRQMLRRRRRRRLAVAAGAPLRLGGAGSDDEAEGDEERGELGAEEEGEARLAAAVRRVVHNYGAKPDQLPCSCCQCCCWDLHFCTIVCASILCMCSCWNRTQHNP